MAEARQQALEWVDEAVANGSRLKPACEIVGISLRTLQRWRSQGTEDQRRGRRARPTNQLSEAERAQVLAVANSPEYCDLSPNQIVPKLADAGEYIASESTFYRVLRQQKLLTHRQPSQPKISRELSSHVASGPNQVWSWDITWLQTLVRGLYFYLYMILDLYSRKIIAWQVYDRESGELASELIQEGCYQEGIEQDQVILHSDNGSPMKASITLATLQVLGVAASFSRPSVSNDNAFSEALFRTLKYQPWYPQKPFADLAEARAWVEQFVQWYNHVHQHSGIRYVTPVDRHEGRDVEILANRHRVYHQARQRHPERWTGKLRNWQPIESVLLNPGKEDRVGSMDERKVVV